MTTAFPQKRFELQAIDGLPLTAAERAELREAIEELDRERAGGRRPA